MADAVDAFPAAGSAGTSSTGTAALPDGTILPSTACISLKPPVPPLRGQHTADLSAASARTCVHVRKSIAPSTDAIAPADNTTLSTRTPAHANPAPSARTRTHIPPVYPSRLPRDQSPTGPNGSAATRWTDPQLAAAYAERDDAAERETVWPLLQSITRPAQPRRQPGRPDGSVLELGCGLGALAQRLAERNWLRVYAFDISPAIHRRGATHFRDAWVERILPDSHDRIPLRRGQCTAAVAQRVLLHLAHPCLMIGLMTDARRVLRTGAPFAAVERDTTLVAPDHDGAAYTELYPLRDGTTLPVTAWQHSPATIVDCLASAAFEVEEIIPLQPADPSSADPRPADPLLLYRARAV